MTQPSLPLCGHARTNGRLCESPALHAKRYCYYHQRDHDRRIRIEQNLEYRRGCIASGKTHELHCLLPDGKTAYDDNSAELFHDLQPSIFEDGDAIQVELSTLYRAISTRQLDAQTARLLLYNLQIASNNLRNAHPPSWRLAMATQDEAPIKPFAPIAEAIHRVQHRW